MIYINTHDLFSDIIVRIKNAQRAYNTTLELPQNKFVLNLLDVLYEEGYIRGYLEESKPNRIENTENPQNKGGKHISVYLKYKEGKPAIHNIIRYSKQSKRTYVHSKDLYMLKKKEPRVTYIVSTSKGLFPDYKAISMNVGGELLFGVM